jgi:DNA mismatch repair protein MSH5
VRPRAPRATRADIARADGAGLFCGVITHLQTRAGGCPKVLAATHFHDVFGADVLRADAPLVGYVHMQVMLSTAQGAVVLADDRSSTAGDESEARRLAGKITYLYRQVNARSSLAAT